MNKIKLPISDKEKIRQEVTQRISVLRGEEKIEACHCLHKKLLASDSIKKAENIIIYQALGDEIALLLLVEKLEKQNKNIFIIDSSGNYCSLPSGGVILVPGRAFTLSGKRIGRGSGWYDRFLRKYPKFHRIGIGFDCQIFPDLPQEEHDISMNEVITG